MLQIHIVALQRDTLSLSTRLILSLFLFFLLVRLFILFFSHILKIKSQKRNIRKKTTEKRIPSHHYCNSWYSILWIYYSQILFLFLLLILFFYAFIWSKMGTKKETKCIDSFVNVHSWLRCFIVFFNKRIWVSRWNIKREAKGG